MAIGNATAWTGAPWRSRRVAYTSDRGFGVSGYRESIHAARQFDLAHVSETPPPDTVGTIAGASTSSSGEICGPPWRSGVVVCVARRGVVRGPDASHDPATTAIPSSSHRCIDDQSPIVPKYL